MKTNPHELRREAAALKKNADDMQTRIDGEGRDWTAEEDAEFKSLCEKAVTLNEQAGNIEQQVAGRAAALNAISGITPPAPGRQAAPDPPQRASVVVGDAGWQKDPSFGFAQPSDFFKAVHNAYRGGKVAPNLDALKAAAGADEAGTFNDPYGGFFVPKTFLPGLRTTAAPADPIEPLVTKIPMQSPVVEIHARVDKTHTNSVSGGLRVYRRAEANTVTASRMETELITYKAESLMGVSYATEELLRASPGTYYTLLAQGFADEFASKKINERLNGTGVGQFLGILKSGALITVSKESGPQTAATIWYENIIKMMAQAWRFGNSVWMVNHSCIPQLAQLSMTIGTAGYPMLVLDGSKGMPMSLFGRPVIVTEYCSTLGTLGDIILADWSQYLEGDYHTMETASSIHVRFLEHEQTFKFYEMNDARPWWTGVLTPKNGTTQSPFITLEART